MVYDAIIMPSKMNYPIVGGEIDFNLPRFRSQFILFRDERHMSALCSVDFLKIYSKVEYITLKAPLCFILILALCKEYLFFLINGSNFESVLSLIVSIKSVIVWAVSETNHC